MNDVPATGSPKLVLLYIFFNILLFVNLRQLWVCWIYWSVHIFAKYAIVVPCFAGLPWFPVEDLRRGPDFPRLKCCLLEANRRTINGYGLVQVDGVMHWAVWCLRAESIRMPHTWVSSYRPLWNLNRWETWHGRHCPQFQTTNWFKCVPGIIMGKHGITAAVDSARKNS